ncbi:FtsX-like permease family protein [Clostridium sp. JNZ X4-2]
MIKLLFKNTLIKIKKSFGRYISLFIILTVGFGFFLGLKETSSDIVNSVSKYYNTHKLMDFKVVSTMGLTDEDVKAIKLLKGVQNVVPSYSLDVLEGNKAIRVHGLENSVNTVKLISGRMPATSKECIADSKKYKVGDKITIDSAVGTKLKNTAFTVVGTVESPLYMDTDYGNTTMGDGKLSSFIFVNKDNFNMGAYTEIYITAANTKNVASYSQKYDDISGQINNELVKLKPERENARYHEIYSSAMDKINDNQTKLNTEKADAEKKLTDAKVQLDTSKTKIENAKKDISVKETELQKKAVDQKSQFQRAKDKIVSSRNQIDAALSSKGISEKELDTKINELNSAVQSIKEQQGKLPVGSHEYEQLSTQLNQYLDSYKGLIQLQTSINTLNDQEIKLNQGIAVFDTQMDNAKEKITKGKTQLMENERKLNYGYSEYNKNLSSFNTKISDAQSKLDNVKKDISATEKTKWYIYNRDDILAGYSNLKGATDTITSVAAVFPLFIILIVMLMTSNTMARMIMEERGELGTLASLGFKNTSIVSTYLFYVLSSTVLGTIAGFFIFGNIIPNIIYSTFNEFILPPLIIQHNITNLLLSLAVVIALMTAVTIFFCSKALKQEPAALMQPVPPQNGQRILLEKISFIWKRLSFNSKTTMRNIFRYKQRVLMIIVGVAGCTALLVTGFGIKDSINGVAEKQYGEIFKYNTLITLKNDTANMGEDLKDLLAEEKVENPLLIKQAAFKAESSNQSLDTYLVVPSDESLFKKYYTLRSQLTGNNIKIDNSGVVITQKLAEVLKIGRGDTIKVKDADNKLYSLKVSDVAENYMQNYIYISKNLYGKVFGKNISYNMIAASYRQNKNVLSKHLLEEEDSIINVTFKDDILQKAAHGNKNLNNIVVMLVVIASILVIIVLYNLTSINMSERKREIATLKVLGFNDGETNQYIYRETFLLTLISIGAGLLLGIPFHRFVIGAIENNADVYFKNIHTSSFIWSSLIIILVSSIMQIVTYFKIKKINMIESLKSIE